ncbi:MAG: hypothetical protein ABIR30_04080 [Chitinophagaceae bacterium]
MESTLEQIESVISKAAKFAETKAELWKLKAAGKISETVSSLISKIAIVILAGLALIILSLGAAYWIGTRLNNLYYGFFIVGGFYALAGLFVFIFRKSLIKKPLTNLIIDKIV